MSGDPGRRRKLKWPNLLNEHERDDEVSSSTSSDEPQDCNWWVLSGVFLIQFLVYGMISSYGVLIAWQVEKKGVTLKLAFWTPAVFTAAWFISDPLSRKISTKSARRLSTAGVLLIVAGIVSSTTILPTTAHLVGSGLVSGMGTSLILKQTEVVLGAYWGSSRRVGFRQQCIPLLSAAVAQFLGPLLMFGLLIQFGTSGAPLLQAAIILHALFGVIALRPPAPKRTLPVLNRYRPRSFTVTHMDELDSIVQRDRFITAQRDISTTESGLPDLTAEIVPSRAISENTDAINLLSIYKSRCRNENGVEILPKILEETEEDINVEAAETHQGSVQILHRHCNKWSPLKTPALENIPETGISKSLEAFLDDVERESKRNLKRAQKLKGQTRWSIGTLEEILQCAEWDELQTSLIDSEYLKVVKCDDKSDNTENDTDCISNVEETQVGTYKHDMKKWHIIGLDSPYCQPQEQITLKQRESQNSYIYCSKKTPINDIILHDKTSVETHPHMLENSTSCNEETINTAANVKISDNFLVNLQNSTKNNTEVFNRENQISTNTLPCNTEKQMAPSDVPSCTVSWIGPPQRNKKHRWSTGSLEDMGKIKLKWDGFVKSDKQKWQSVDSSCGNEFQNSLNRGRMEDSNQVYFVNSKPPAHFRKEHAFSDYVLQLHNTEHEDMSDVIAINTVKPHFSQVDSVEDCGSPSSIRRLLHTSTSKEEVTTPCSSLQQFQKLFTWSSFTHMDCKCQCTCHALPYLSLRGYFTEPYFLPSLFLHFTSRFCPVTFLCLTPSISRSWRHTADEEAAFSVSISGFVWFCLLLLMPWCSRLTTSKRKWIYISGVSCAALGLYLLSRALNHSQMTLGCALFGLGQGVITATGNNVIQDALGPWSLSKLHTRLHIVSGLLAICFAGIIGFLLEGAESSGLSHCFTLIAGLEIAAGFSWLVKPMLSIVIHIYHHKYCPDHNHRHSAVLWNADSHMLLSG